MMNGVGAAYNLVSFLGVDDLCTLTPPVVQTVLLNACLQDGPVLLKASDFNLQTSEVETKTILMGHPTSCCHAPVVRSFFIHCKMIISP
jgi:hypothetical protein